MFCICCDKTLNCLILMTSSKDDVTILNFVKCDKKLVPLFDVDLVREIGTRCATKFFAHQHFKALIAHHQHLLLISTSFIACKAETTFVAVKRVDFFKFFGGFNLIIKTSLTKSREFCLHCLHMVDFACVVCTSQ